MNFRDAIQSCKRMPVSEKSVNGSSPDPWLYVPAAALLLVGALMVLNTTYFLGLAKTGDGFYYFKAQMLHIAAGIVLCILLSQFSRAGLRRLAAPMAALSSVLLVAVWIPGVGLVRGGAR